MFRCQTITVLAALIASPIVRAQGPASAPATQTAPAATRPAEPEKLTDAERIARTRRSIAETEKQLAQLKTEIASPSNEYTRAESIFTEIDTTYSSRKKEAARLQESGDPAATTMSAELDDLEKRWKLAKDRFDLAIQERKTLQEQIVTLEKKLARDRQALERLTTPRIPATQTASAPPLPPTTSAPASPPPTADVAAKPTAEAGKLAPTPSPGQLPPLLDKSKIEPPPSKELATAREDAERKQAVAKEAEHEAISITGRLESLRANIDLERRLLETAGKQADNARATVRAFSDELQKKSIAGAPQAELQSLWNKRDHAEKRLAQATAEVTERTSRIDALQDELANLQSDEINALREAESRRREAESAQKRVDTLANPFAPQNLLRWLLRSGVRVLGIALGMLAVLWLSGVLKARLVAVVARGATEGSPEERENRAKTLVGVFQNAVSIVIIVGGSLMIFTELGVDIAPLLGGAAVAGLAIAFGAQNLIRDYFSGFMILLENQYAINDVIKVAGVSGQVEKITLRITVLRDIEGIVHFIPNGQITGVSNMTHAWSRALFDIGIAYKEDVDRVMRILVDLGKELRRDPQYRNMILEDPEMLGVESLGDSSVVIRFFLKTRATQKWPVRREMLRRIKKKFDELGVEIPFPQRTVHHRNDGGPTPPAKFPAPID